MLILLIIPIYETRLETRPVTTAYKAVLLIHCGGRGTVILHIMYVSNIFEEALLFFNAGQKILHH